MSPDDMQRFEVRGVWQQDGTASMEIRCDLCGWYFEPEEQLATLAELVQRAEEHTEVCR